MTSVERLTTEKLRDRKMSSGTSGFFRTAISTGNATSATAPIPSAANASGSCHACCWPRVAPKASPPTATMATTAPSQSNRPVAPSLRDSGTARSAMSAMATSGRLMTNAARHVTVWTRKPPRSGPSVSSADVDAAQTPIARPRSSPSKAAVMIESAPGTRSAPAAPWRRRARISTSIVGATPQIAEVIPNPSRPSRKMRRRPRRSESAPARTRSAASTARYPLATYVRPSSRPTSDAGSSRPIVSRATFTIVPSRKTIPDPRTTASRIGPRRELIARDEHPSRPRAMSSRRGPILLAVVLGSGIVFLDGTIVNVALETIGRELPASLVGRLEGLTYVSSGYLAVLAALLVLAGALSDRLGRRRIFRLGLLGFGITSAICGAAGALLVPGALSIITASFDGEERGRAIGVWAASTSALLTLGPLLGGFLVQTVSWRAAFLINLPLVVIALIALRAVPESRNEGATGRFDWLGAVVAIVAVGGLAFGATRGQQQAWQDPLAFAALGIGAVALVAFPVLMAVRKNPLVPLDIFRSRNFSVVNLSTLVIYGALYVSLTFQNLFLQGTLGYTPLASGIIGIPSSLLLTLLSTPAGRLAARHGARPFMVAGPLLMGAGLFWISRIPATSAAWAAQPDSAVSLVPPVDFLVDVLPTTLLFGVGIAMLVAPLTTALMASVPVARAGLGSAINNAVSRVGAPLVRAALLIAITATFTPSLAAKAPAYDRGSPPFSTIQPLAPTPAGTPPDLAAAARARRG